MLILRQFFELLRKVITFAPDNPKNHSYEKEFKNRYASLAADVYV
jgi:hypothetical protein